MLMFVVVVSVLVASVHSHTRWVCPRPESGNSGIKSGPCSAENNDFDAIYTDITPGPLTLRYEESINHKNAPSRISLNKYGDNENVCMLLDQIPHNEAGTMNIGDDCWPFDWPIGRCNTQHYITVNIPDIECDRCYLQVISIMTDKYSDSELPCWQESVAVNNCSSYFSCANVKIRPTEAGRGKGIDACTDYASNLVGQWPYRPQNMYESTLTGPDVTLHADAVHDPQQRRLTVTLPAETANLGQKLQIWVMGLESNEELGRGDVIIAAGSVTAVVISGNLDGSSLTGGTGLVLMNEVGGVGLEIAKGPLVLTDKKFERDYYGRHGLDFTETGWLQGEPFIGEGATYPFVVQPHGPCTPPTTYYAGSFEVSGSGTHGAGVVSVTLSENHGWVRASFSGLTSVTGVRLYQEGDVSGLPSLDIPTSLIREGRQVDAMLDMSTATESGGSVRREDVPREAAVDIKAHGTMDFTVVVSRLAAGSRVEAVTVNGPARQGMVGDKMISLNHYSTDSGAVASVTLKEADVNVLDSFWGGLAYVSIHTSNSSVKSRQISGQISIPGETFCKNNDNTCFSSRLSKGGELVDRGLPKVDTNGRATFRLNSNGTLDYRITLRDTPSDEKVLQVLLNTDVTLSKDFTKSIMEDKVQVVSGRIEDPSDELLEDLATGGVTIEVFTTRYNTEPLYGQLPAIDKLPSLYR